MSITERAFHMEELMIEHCAPTLASLKSANLFMLPYDSAEQLAAVVAIWNRRFKSKGVSVRVLRRSNGRAMIYVYRSDKLQGELSKRGVGAFLKTYGYESTDAEYAVGKLCERIDCCGSFPHEIGLFLGYPLGDVIGFIRNGGQNCKCSGYWKVYCDPDSAERTFRKFTKCRTVYSRLWRQGRSIMRLTVA